MTARLGPPLEVMLARHLSEDAVGPAGDRFRALYPEHAVVVGAGAARCPRGASPPYAGTVAGWSS